MPKLISEVIDLGCSVQWVTAKEQNRTRKINCRFLRDNQRALIIYGDVLDAYHKNQKFKKFRQCPKCQNAMKFLVDKDHFDCYECHYKLDKNGIEIKRGDD